MAKEPDFSRQEFVPDARDVLLHRARLGEITPDEAEKEAKRLGLEPFARLPRPSEFNPREKSRWSLAMVLAWIVWREFDEVRAWDNEYREACSAWTRRTLQLPTKDGTFGEPVTGWFVDPVPLRCGLMFEAFGYLPADMDESRLRLTDAPKRAKGDLWRRLQEGELTAEGIPARGGARVQVPKHEWVDLQNVRGRGDGDEYFRFRHEPIGRAYTDVRWSRSEVLETWPENEPTPKPKRRAATPHDAVDLQAFIVDQLAATGLPPSSDQTIRWASNRGLSRDWVREQRRSLPEDSKQRRGAPGGARA